MNYNSTHIGLALAVLVACVAAYFLFPRRSIPRIKIEGFQGTPQALIGDPETCKIMKNILNVTNAKLEQAQASNNPTELNIIITTKESIEKQYAALKCT
jgi:hypothetical protein